MEYLCIVCGGCRKSANGKFSYEVLCKNIDGKWEVEGEHHNFSNNMPEFMEDHSECKKDGFFIEYH